MTSIEFWYEFASTYSYPTAMRVEEIGKANGVEVIWKPFLLGPIFGAQGWHNSPFNIYKAKGEYMWRDMARICQQAGLAFHRSDNFPQNGLLAARLALTKTISPVRAAFSRQVYLLQFGLGRDISEPDNLVLIIEKLGLDAKIAFQQAGDEAVKLKLRENTQIAQDKGVFGAPSLITQDGELFWGNDRLKQAVAWAAR